MNKISELYVGLDDSNHAGVNKKGEIEAAVFSTRQEDSLVRVFPNTRSPNSKQVSPYREWASQWGRDYRFTVLLREEYSFRDSSRNIVQVAPLLINRFMLEAEVIPHTLKIYIDGGLDSEGKKHLREQFSHIERMKEEGS